MRTPVWVGIALFACAAFILLIGGLSGLFPNLADTIRIVIVSLVPTMIVSGASLIWLGRKPDEQELRRKEDIHRAIKRWNETPFGGFRKRTDTLPLAEKAPELAVEIEKCLSHYQSVYANLQKLRQEYHEWKDTDSTGRFSRVENGKTIIDLRLAYAYDDSMCRSLLLSHSQLIEQIKSEILDKHYTSLKA